MSSSALMMSAALAALVLAAAPVAQAAINKPVKTTDGLLAGVPGTQPGVTVFKGIPFGAPPVGDLRWKPPQPVTPWTGVRAADKFGHVCMQPHGVGRMNVTVDLPDSPGMSEDCLYLNVWTPTKKAGAKLPVMVWIYGGAYSEGGGSSVYNDGDKLATKGVVMVTFNYRLGALGFLSHPELTAESPNHASGNYALMDAVTVLKWVKANIAAFGGDPDNVTIFGQSAGACMVAALAGVPGAKDLFERGISESGAWMGLGITKMTTREAAEQRTLEAQQKLGLKSLADLRAMSAEDILTKVRGQGMIVDGWVVAEDLSKTFAEGRQNPVDVLVGSNAEEGGFTSGFGPPTTLASWKDGALKRWGSLADQGLAAYPASSDEEAKAQSTRPFTDAMAWDMRLFAQSQAKLGKKAWLYRFAHRPPYDPGKPALGAVHASEVAYVFDNLEKPRLFPDGSSPQLASASPAEGAFAKEVSQYWVNFARTGDPNGPGLPKWPELKELGPTQAMVLDAGKSGAGPWLSQPQIDFYAALYDRDVAAK
jgi:para-nitrobenzyl esterase